MKKSSNVRLLLAISYWEGRGKEQKKREARGGGSEEKRGEGGEGGGKKGRGKRGRKKRKLERGREERRKEREREERKRGRRERKRGRKEREREKEERKRGRKERERGKKEGEKERKEREREKEERKRGRKERERGKKEREEGRWQSGRRGSKVKTHTQRQLTSYSISGIHTLRLGPRLNHHHNTIMMSFLLPVSAPLLLFSWQRVWDVLVRVGVGGGMCVVCVQVWCVCECGKNQWHSLIPRPRPNFCLQYRKVGESA